MASGRVRRLSELLRETEFSRFIPKQALTSNNLKRQSFTCSGSSYSGRKRRKFPYFTGTGGWYSTVDIIQIDNEVTAYRLRIVLCFQLKALRTRKYTLHCWKVNRRLALFNGTKWSMKLKNVDFYWSVHNVHHSSRRSYFFCGFSLVF